MPKFSGKGSIKTISKRNFGFMILRKIKVSLPIDVRRMPLLELPIKRRKKRQCGAKIKKEKKNVRWAPRYNANGDG